jgi:hypothetical protein
VPPARALASAPHSSASASAPRRRAAPILCRERLPPLTRLPARRPRRAAPPCARARRRVRLDRLHRPAAAPTPVARARRAPSSLDQGREQEMAEAGKT